MKCSEYLPFTKDDYICIEAPATANYSFIYCFTIKLFSVFADTVFLNIWK